jgi:prepilin-type N-terminal cleavage/methylation domain-containing protein
MNKKGFTLIELLVVISIISLLSSIVMASLNTARMKSRTVRSLEDLRQINTAILAYYAENGSYPVSTGGSGPWDGYSTCWGDALGSIWIPDLVPKYIPALPREPANNTACNIQYIYNSNGVDYKLLYHQPEDIDGVISAYPNLVDPRRPFHAYGYWTPGAADNLAF